MPVPTVTVRLTRSISWIWFIRLTSTTIPPRSSTASVSPVPPSRGTTGTFSSLAIRTTAATCSVDVGSTWSGRRAPTSGGPGGRRHAGAVVAVRLRREDLVVGEHRPQGPDEGLQPAGVERAGGEVGEGDVMVGDAASGAVAAASGAVATGAAAAPAVASARGRRNAPAPGAGRRRRRGSPPTVIPSDCANNSWKSTTSMSWASPASPSGRSDQGQALTRVSTSSSAARSSRSPLIFAVSSGFSIGRPPPWSSRTMGHPVDVLEREPGDRLQQLRGSCQMPLRLLSRQVVVRDRAVDGHRRGQPARASRSASTSMTRTTSMSNSSLKYFGRPR